MATIVRTLRALLVLYVMLLCVNAQKADAQPAPKLTSLKVVAVRSQKYPDWDPIPANWFLTPQDHGGSWLLVQTDEIGYSNPATQNARFNGVKMTLYYSQAILNGRTVIGWHYVWLYSGSFTSGQFTYSATSINSPWNTMSTWINVK